MRVFLAGATGVIGQRLVPQLVEAGHTVIGMTRSEASAAALRTRDHDHIEHIEAVVCDVYDRARLVEAVTAARPDAVVHQLTALPKRINPRKVQRDLAATNRLRTEGTRNLVDAASAAGAARFVAQSIAFAHHPETEADDEPNDRPRTEDDPLYLDAPSSFRPMVAAVAELERLTLIETAACDPPIVGVALRYGLFRGPGTVYAPGGSFHEDISKRRVPIVGDGGGVFNFVHVDDAAAATVLALDHDTPDVFHIVEAPPIRARDFLPAYAEHIGAKKPWRIPRWLGRLGAGAYGVYLMCEQPPVSGARAREVLGWEPMEPRAF